MSLIESEGFGDLQRSNRKDSDEPNQMKRSGDYKRSYRKVPDEPNQMKRSVEF